MMLPLAAAPPTSSSPKSAPVSAAEVHLQLQPLLLSNSADDGDGKSMGSGKDEAKGPSTLRFLFCAGGIFVCYFFYGILQERM